MREQRRAQTAARNGGAASHTKEPERLHMPRGSKPGTKRGGRKRGTPNRTTILADRILVAAAAHPVAVASAVVTVARVRKAAAQLIIAANLDRRLGLRPGRHREKAPRAAGNPLRNSTDFESHPVRENPGR
jgi:hypothetical protein